MSKRDQGQLLLPLYHDINVYKGDDDINDKQSSLWVQTTVLSQTRKLHWHLLMTLFSGQLF